MEVGINGPANLMSKLKTASQTIRAQVCVLVKLQLQSDCDWEEVDAAHVTWDVRLPSSSSSVPSSLPSATIPPETMAGNPPAPPRRRAVPVENKPSLLLTKEENQLVFDLLGKRCFVSPLPSATNAISLSSPVPGHSRRPAPHL